MNPILKKARIGVFCSRVCEESRETLDFKLYLLSLTFKSKLCLTYYESLCKSYSNQSVGLKLKITRLNLLVYANIPPFGHFKVADCNRNSIPSGPWMAVIARVFQSSRF